MTDEEVTRFALQLTEAERIRTMIASEEGSFARGGSDEQSSGAAVPVEGHSSATVMTSAA